MAQLTPAPKFAATYVDGSGNTKPAVGYKLYSYSAGTTTPKDTYTDYTIGTANANPVVLDARGEASVWLSGNYKLVLKDPADSTIWTVDDVRDLSSNQTLTGMTLAGALTVTSTAVTWSGNPTHSGNHTFSGNVLINGSTTLGDNSVDSLTVLPASVTWSSTPTHSGNHTWSGTQTYNGDVTSVAAHTFSTIAPTCAVGATFGNVARAGSTVLDWYEEGVLTVGFNFGGGTTGMSTNNSGSFTRIGNLVFFNFVVSLTTKGSSTGTANITGLPYASGNAGNAAYAASFAIVTGLTGAPFVQLATGTTTFTMSQTSATGDAAALTDTTFSNGSAIRCAGMYRV